MISFVLSVMPAPQQVGDSNDHDLGLLGYHFSILFHFSDARTQLGRIRAAPAQWRLWNDRKLCGTSVHRLPFMDTPISGLMRLN